jgi:mono/diheme cytochrome c family protein
MSLAHVVACALMLFGAFAVSGERVAAADVANGERLAQRWCVSCHLVARGQSGPATEAPPFSELAARANFDARGVAYFLLTPHPRMPDMGLTRTEATDLAAFIGSVPR